MTVDEPTNLECDRLTAKRITINNPDPAVESLIMQAPVNQASDILKMYDANHNLILQVQKDGNIVPRVLGGVRYLSAFPSLQAAILDGIGGDINSGGKSTVFIPVGEHEITQQTTLPSYTTLLGAGRMNSRLVYTNENSPEGSCALMFRPTYADIGAGGLCGRGIDGHMTCRDFWLAGTKLTGVDGFGNTCYQNLGTGVYGGFTWLAMDNIEITRFRRGWGVFLDPLRGPRYNPGAGPTSSQGTCYRGGSILFLKFMDVEMNWVKSGMAVLSRTSLLKTNGNHVFCTLGTGLVGLKSSGLSAYLIGGYSVDVEFCTYEYVPWGLEVIACRLPKIDTCYFEGITQNALALETCTGGYTANCTFYGVGIALSYNDMRGHVVFGNRIESAVANNYLMGTESGWYFSNIADYGQKWYMGTLTKNFRGWPGYLEEVRTDGSWPSVNPGTELVPRARLLKGVIENQGAVMMMRAYAGAPSDATHGSFTGQMVFDKSNAKFYMRMAGSFGSPNAWRSASLS